MERRGEGEKVMERRGKGLEALWTREQRFSREGEIPGLDCFQAECGKC